MPASSHSPWFWRWLWSSEGAPSRSAPVPSVRCPPSSRCSSWSAGEPPLLRGTRRLRVRAGGGGTRWGSLCPHSSSRGAFWTGISSGTGGSPDTAGSWRCTPRGRNSRSWACRSDPSEWWSSRLWTPLRSWQFRRWSRTSNAMSVAATEWSPGSRLPAMPA